MSPLLSNLFLARFNKTIEKFQPAIEKEIGFCTEDVKKDFHGAFDFQGRDKFFQKCHDKLQDLPTRICTVSELKVYFTSFLRNGGDKKSVSESHFLEPNRNCNLTSWSAGCEPGWASSVNLGQKYDYNETNPKKMPFRTTNSKPCCEGFFCPEGLTCMIPCPLGAHCPVAKLDPASGICLPNLFTGTVTNYLQASPIILVVQLICGSPYIWVTRYFAIQDIIVQQLSRKSNAL
ncbi:hypothetical protein R6Q57_023818 [Mikania cordata]